MDTKTIVTVSFLMIVIVAVGAEIYVRFHVNKPFHEVKIDSGHYLAPGGTYIGPTFQPM